MTRSTINTFERAQHHAITRDRPAVNFFEGALLGNGGLGAVLTTRPDAVVIHFGHNNVWDIRVAEEHRDEIGTFQSVFERVKQIPAHYTTLEQDEWYRHYCELMQANYRAPYPRPFPCGSLVLGFDRHEAELLGHQLDVATGLCEVFFDVKGRHERLQVFVDPHADRTWLRYVDAYGQLTAAPFERIHLLPDPATPPDLPSYTSIEDTTTHRLAFRQTLPSLPATPALDRAFSLSIRTASALESRSRVNWAGVEEQMGPLERSLSNRSTFVACVQLTEDLDACLVNPLGDIPVPDEQTYEMVRSAGTAQWQAFWNQSGVALDDDLLERIWYWNLYFLNCSAKAGTQCPGLFANWNYRNIGTAWHGDYHMNYNTQQPFWGTFSTNHVDKHLPYVQLVHRLLPLSRSWAHDYYGLRGAYFPHSAYPAQMNIMPYPVPTWGWELCETPWTVQSLWWHYVYTLDRDFLAQQAFEPLREAVLFLVDYLRRPEAHGQQWGDDRYHIFPTAPPELYGLTPGLSRNFDCIVDLTLTRFVLKAFIEACQVLGREESEAALIGEAQDVLAHLPDYPTADSPHGTVFVSVPGEDAGTVYNVPNSTMTVFPGEDHGLHSPREQYERAANSYRQQHNEGGNDLVFLNLQGARLGLLDLERFKRQVLYCLLPNGTCTDMVLQVHGRYSDTTPYDFMAPMGIWFENFALPAVIDECLLQSYNGELRLFPNWPKGRRAEFRTLRAAGAFLVSANVADGAVQWVEVVSEAGAPLKVINPWDGPVRVTRSAGEIIITGDRLTMDTQPGEVIGLQPG